MRIGELQYIYPENIQASLESLLPRSTPKPDTEYALSANLSLGHWHHVAKALQRNQVCVSLSTITSTNQLSFRASK
jgi:hypothetical protein